MNSTSVLVQDAVDRFDFLSDVHVVGGAVRDSIVGRESDDIDLATSDVPEVTMEKCEAEGMNVVETGIGHGTVTAITEDGGEFEITTFRRDVSTDGRNATVEFADSVEEDLARRDFTINAMAFDGDEVIDPFGGWDHIHQGVVSTVGDPERRFREDFLRVIRALRFASRFGFDIRSDEWGAMESVAPEVIENVSEERVFMEIKKAFQDQRPSQFLEGLVDLGILEDVFGEPVFRWFSMIEALEGVHERLVAFFVIVNNNTSLDFDDIQVALKLPNGLVSDARRASELLDGLDFTMTEFERRRMLADFFDVLNLSRNIGVRAFGMNPLLFSEPDDVPLRSVLSGQDLLDAGFEEGPKIGELLDEAHRVQLSEEVTDKDVLLSRLTEA